jgi:hypothetical protein
MPPAPPTGGPELHPTHKRLRPFLLLAALTLILPLAAWVTLFTFHPDCRHDPRSPRYLLWKYCALPMPKDDALATAFLDPGRNRLVAGLTPAQVERKFGLPLLRADGPDLTNTQQRYDGTGDHAWLGDSWCVVQFQNGRAVSFEIRKG